MPKSNSIAWMSQQKLRHVRQSNIHFKQKTVSSGVAYLLQGSKSCALRDALLHTWCAMSRIWVTVAFLSAQTSLAVLHNAFSNRELQCFGNFLFFWPFSANPRDCPLWKSQWISSFWNTQTSPSGTSYPLQNIQVAFSNATWAEYFFSTCFLKAHSWFKEWLLFSSIVQHPWQ